MSNAVIITEVAGGIGTVTLNKPWKLNAWDTPMRAEITAVLNGWNRDSAVKAVIMTGAGERAFCAGQDLEETEKFQSGSEGANWFQSWRDFYNAIRGLDKPCLAALNGVAAGSAFQAVMLTDVRIGHPGVRMGQPEINAGIPSVTGPMLMLPRIGLARTMELTLTGRMMDVHEAERAGLVSRVVPYEKLMEECLGAALSICDYSQLAVLAAKESVNRAFESGLADGVMFERRLFHALFATEDQKEGMDAFVNKRKAQFRNV